MADKKPLWLQIRNHPSLFCLHPTPQQIATIFRVIADAVAREEDEPRQSTMVLSTWIRESVKWQQRVEIRVLLLAEAERAEETT
jgi:hypothetical protein